MEDLLENLLRQAREEARFRKERHIAKGEWSQAAALRDLCDRLTEEIYLAQKIGDENYKYQRIQRTVVPDESNG